MKPAWSFARRDRAGLTVVEAVLSLTVYASFVAALSLVLRGLSQNVESTGARQQLAREALVAIAAIRLDLQRAGWVQLDGAWYPRTADAGDADPDWPALDHPAPDRRADEPQSRVVVLRHPADAGADGWPDVDAGGGALWDPQAVAWLVTAGPDGANALVRRTSAGAERRYGTRIRWIVFETPVETGFAIPLDSLRVRARFEAVGAGGRPLALELEETVRLRNGGLAP